jgi:hypothetical protein
MDTVDGGCVAQGELLSMLGQVLRLDNGASCGVALAVGLKHERFKTKYSPQSRENVRSLGFCQGGTYRVMEKAEIPPAVSHPTCAVCRALKKLVPSPLKPVQSLHQAGVYSEESHTGAPIIAPGDRLQCQTGPLNRQANRHARAA